MQQLVFIIILILKLKFIIENFINTHLLNMVLKII